MKTPRFRNLLLGAALLAAGALSAQAQTGLFITEVDPSGSSSSYGVDWFELTNTGSTAVSLAGWKMDDNSASFGSAVALRGVTSIGSGQSIIFFEGSSGGGSSDLTTTAAFNSAWGTSLVFGSTIGAYGGSGVGLSTGGDQVNLYSSAGGSPKVSVTFGGATDGVSFDNSADRNNATISALSAVGTNGAYLSSIGEKGSPGFAVIPEPSTYALMIGLGAMGLAAFRRKRALAA